MNGGALVTDDAGVVGGTGDVADADHGGVGVFQGDGDVLAHRRGVGAVDGARHEDGGAVGWVELADQDTLSNESFQSDLKGMRR